MLLGICPTFPLGRFSLMCWIGERKMVRAVPFGRLGLSANVIALFLGFSYWPLTDEVWYCRLNPLHTVVNSEAHEV